MNGFKKKIAVLLRQLPDPLHRLPEEWRQSRLRNKVVRFIRESAGDSWKPRPKVFGIGLSKTGTVSLSHALRALGYRRSLHWARNGKILGWPEFFYADAATDICCSSQFESLYYAFEDSKFIYTTRDIDSWVKSIKKHYGVEKPNELRRLHKSGDFWERKSGWKWYSSIRMIQVRESLYAQHDSWREAYETFDDRVNRFFRDKSSDRFLEMSVTNGDGWGRLCDFLGEDTPNRDFPHKNKSH